MVKISGALTSYPARISFAAYFALILLGTCVLHLSVCWGKADSPITWMEAAFTTVSACCVTGLGVRSTANDFSLIGQITILVLIQVGGIGILTLSNFMMLQIGGTLRMREKRVLYETLGAHGKEGFSWVLRNILRFTFVVEAIGTLILFVRFAFEMSFTQAAWHAIFHSVSAFCNAGFSLNDESLIPYQDDWIVNITICGLIILGGIGFPVILDVLRANRKKPLREQFSGFQLHTKLMLLGTLFFILLGALTFLLVEWDNALAEKSWSGTILIPFFQSVTCRTAGFNSIDQNDLTNASIAMTMFLMFVGGGACSTAGGLKASAAVLIFLKAWSQFRGWSSVQLFRRSIPQSTFDKVSTLSLFYTLTVALSLILLLLIEQNDVSNRERAGLFSQAVFEVLSAVGTVGLSLGLTTKLSEFGWLILMILMFVGRLGPISVFSALSLPSKQKILSFVTEEPLVG